MTFDHQAEPGSGATPEHMRILALETAVTPGSLALLVGRSVIHCQTFGEGVPTTRVFAAAIRVALAAAGWAARDVELFAVHSGPGSFTGLRIGVTAAKTFAYATRCAVLGIDTMKTVAAGVPHPCDSLWTVMDAQRNQLLTARFRVAPGAIDQLEATRIRTQAEWMAQLAPHDWVVGPASGRLPGSGPQGIRLVDPRYWLPDAAVLGRLAYDEFSSGRRQSCWSLEARYHRPSAAEEKLPPANVRKGPV